MSLTLDLALWIVAGLLALVFLLSSAKLLVPKEKMAGMGAATRWVEDGDGWGEGVGGVVEKSDPG